MSTRPFTPRPFEVKKNNCLGLVPGFYFVWKGIYEGPFYTFGIAQGKLENLLIEDEDGDIYD